MRMATFRVLVKVTWVAARLTLLVLYWLTSKALERR